MSETHEPSRRVVVAGMIGNVLEWYDFAVYGYFAAVIGRHFFPSDDHAVSVIAAFGVFAVGFAARPLGAALFGHLGDRIGRRRVLLISILMMAGPTFLIGVLPTYATIGVAAPAALIVLRLLQGLSVGGELTGSVTYMVEAAPEAKRNLAGSWTLSGAVVGVLLGSAVGAVITGTLSSEEVHEWGWRLPFLVGIVISICGILMRRHAGPAAPPAEREAARPPLVEAVAEHWPAMLRGIGVAALNGSLFYLVFVYLTTYLTDVVQDAEADALRINTINMVILAVLIPIGGWMGDRFGSQRVLLTSAVLILLLAIPLFWLIDHHSLMLSFLGQLAFVVLAAPYLGAFTARMAMMFPAAVRMSGFSVSYNIALAAFGGTAPMIASYLIERGAGDLSPAFYLDFCAALAILSLINARRADPA